MGNIYHLSRRQRHLYTDSVLLFADNDGRTITIDPITAEPLVAGVGSSTYSGAGSVTAGNLVPPSPLLTTEPVRCKITFTENVDSLTAVSRIKRFDLDTADYINFPVGVPEVKNGYWAVTVTRLPSGEKHPNYGQALKILGAAQVIPGAGRRNVNAAMVRISQEEQMPSSIKAWFGQYEQELIETGTQTGV